MSDKASKRSTRLEPADHNGPGDYQSIRTDPHDCMDKQRALSKTSHQATKNQTENVHPGQLEVTNHHTSSSGGSTQTAHPRSRNSPTGAAMDRWLKETPQEQYWNSEGYHARK